MFGFEVKPFSRDHIILNDLRDHEVRMLLSWPNYRDRLLLLEGIGPSWSIFKDGRHISSGGLAPVSLRVAEVWQLPGKNVSEHRLNYAKIYRHFIDMILGQGQYRRLQTVCLDDSLHNRWMQFIGFQKEGVMQKYGLREENYAMYARLK